jgi:hypothetical protein
VRPEPDFEVGNRVYLVTDIGRHLGTVVEVQPGRIRVQWDNGRGTVYCSAWLRRVAEHPPSSSPTDAPPSSAQAAELSTAEGRSVSADWHNPR